MGADIAVEDDTDVGDVEGGGTAAGEDYIDVGDITGNSAGDAVEDTFVAVYVAGGSDFAFGDVVDYDVVVMMMMMMTMMMSMMVMTVVMYLQPTGGMNFLVNYFSPFWMFLQQVIIITVCHDDSFRPVSKRRYPLPLIRDDSLTIQFFVWCENQVSSLVQLFKYLLVFDGLYITCLVQLLSSPVWHKDSDILVSLIQCCLHSRLDQTA